MSAQVPTLATHRLTLRPVDRSDADDIVRIVGDFEVSKWLVPVPHPYEKSDADDFITSVQSGSQGCVWVIEEDAALIGMIGLDPGLGYWLSPERWGQGLMSEAAHAVLSNHFDHSHGDTLRSEYFLGNEGSRRVLENMGFQDRGAKTSFSAAQGTEVPSRRMELTRQAWSALMVEQE
ncbi:MAG: GNAT family N-acetyltransferase [Pseudomonadota bacterium]